MLTAIFYLIGALSNFIFFDNIRAAINSVDDQLVYGSYNKYILSFQNLVIFSGLLVSIKCLQEIIKHGYFTESSKKLMRVAGYIFFFSGVLMTVLDIIRVQSGGDPNIMMGIILMDFMFTLLGFIVIIIADMAQVGFRLKSENDLTI
ncbi:DUF2975 domain-containing protein [Dokdonia sp. Dokd-P16]|uniref:DUF2975 domain-containing protein n=1 Tax=Dokdonia sp. Dokd-P16 TaxID=2173169 RepID=UPI0013A5B928|nr:DUF2975 domain-containing protein [Dokdonia sp. Dokd-P16]